LALAPGQPGMKIPLLWHHPQKNSKNFQ